MPVDTTTDPEVLLGVLISAGSIRCDLIDPAGQVVSRDYVRCTAKTVDRVVFNGYETTNLALFSRSRWPHDGARRSADARRRRAPASTG